MKIPGVLEDGSPPVCSYCKATATQYVLHSEGMAYVAACDEHIEQAKTDAAATVPGGAPDPSNIDNVGSYASADVPAAEGFDDRTSVVVVALPAENDPIVAASSEDIAHITLVWLGDAEQLPQSGVTVEMLKENLASWAASVDGPLTEAVSGTAVLGKDKASVILVDATALAQVRGGMIHEEPEMITEQNPPFGAIATVHMATEQFPTWIPHVTLGYEATPQLAEYAGTEIVFDRFALWVGDDRTEYPMGKALTAAAPAPAAPAEEAPVDEVDEADIDEQMEIPFHGVAAPLGVPTGDKRMFAIGGMSFRNLPLPLAYQHESSHGGEPGKTVVVGHIDKMWIDEENLIQYAGMFSPNVPEVDLVIQGIVDKTVRGVSVDVDDFEIESSPEKENEVQPSLSDVMNSVTVFSKARIAGITIVPIGAFQEAYIALGECDCTDDAVTPEETTPEFAALEFVDEYAEEVPESERTVENLIKFLEGNGVEVLVASAVAEASFAPGTRDGPGWITNPEATNRIRKYWVRGKGALKIKWGVPGDFNRCRAQLAKYIQNPQWLAGACSNMHKEALGVWPGQEGTKGLVSSAAPIFTLIASASPDVSPAEWFKDPGLTEPTALTVDDDGRVYGHLAIFGTCHIGISGACTTPPYSMANYAYFRTGLIETDNGDVPVGHLTMDTGHAGLHVGAGPAAAHYDNTGTAFADVAAGDDGIGIWVAGALRSGLSLAQRRIAKAAALSGDWREIRGNLELVAALAVNTPGFPIPRLALAASAGQGQLSLVASGIITKETENAMVKMSVEDAVGLVASVADELEHRQARKDRRVSLAAKLEPLKAMHAAQRKQRIAQAKRLTQEGGE